MSDLKQRILSRVAGDLADIESALEQNLTPYLELVREVAGHILFSGGKRLRPLLMVLSGRLCGSRGASNVSFSTMFEYLHAATLLHDDLVDDADLRRGKPVAHRVWDNPTAVLVGDFLLARGLSLASQTGLMPVIQVIADITESMSQGEIHQLTEKGNTHLTETDYRQIIHRKTAVLMRGACRAGALVSRAPEDRIEALSSYGQHLGMAFQMADDLLDYTADSRVLGKTVGADLKEGKLTLPVIHALARADATGRTEMERIIGNPDFSVRDFRRVIEIMETFGSLDYTRREAIREIDRAKAALDIFEAGEGKETLSWIADYALFRNV